MALLHRATVCTLDPDVCELHSPQWPVMRGPTPHVHDGTSMPMRQGGVMRIVVDGYNAPVTAGNFVDLVARGFYDGMDIQRADGFVVQTGKPAGSVRFRLWCVTESGARTDRCLAPSRLSSYNARVNAISANS